MEGGIREIRFSSTPSHRVLVVDDVPEICTIFKDLHKRIRHLDVEILTETNALRATKLATEQNFDIVISDFRMRETNGIAVLKSARARNPDGYRVLMSGYNEVPTTTAHLREALIDAYVKKPLHPQELLLLILGFLRGDAALVGASREEARALERHAEALRRVGV